MNLRKKMTILPKNDDDDDDDDDDITKNILKKRYKSKIF